MNPIWSVARNASMLGASSIASRLLAFVLAIALARGLGPDGYGTYALATAILTIALTVLGVGLTPYLTRHVARDRASADRDLRRIFLIRGLAAALGAVVVLIVLLIAPDSDLMRAIAILYFALTFEAIAYLCFAYLQGIERMGFESASTLLASLARTVGGVGLALSTGSLELVLLWMAAVTLAQLIFAWRFLHRIRRDAQGTPKLPKISSTALAKSAAAMMLTTLFAALLLRADSVVIGAFLGVEQVSFYTAAYALVAGVEVLPWVLSVALYPAFARTFGREKHLFRDIWDKGARMALVITVPIALVAAVLSASIVERFYGADFGQAAPVLQILVWSLPFVALTMILAALLRSTDQESHVAAVYGTGAALAVGLSLVVVPVFGLRGAAGLTVGIYAVMLAVMLILARRHGVTLPGPNFCVRAAFAWIVMAGVALAMDEAVVELAVLAAVAIYAIALVRLNVVPLRSLRAIGQALRPVAE